MEKIKIALLGSTGSIGRQVLNCVSRHSDRFEIVSLSANSNAKLLAEQIEKYKPSVAGLSDPSGAMQIPALPNGTQLYTGEHALSHCVLESADIVFVAVMGYCGLQVVLQAINMGKTVALANKEALVAGGKLVKEALKNNPKSKILPVDSEHSAIWQSLGLDLEKPYRKLILTASGGAFRDKTAEELKHVTVQDALKHPNWTMGKKITIDCATMLNKGLEVMEAMWLFDAPLGKIEVVVHPESIVHSMVEYEDSAIVCEMAYPSMEIPIQLALSYPERLKTDVKSFDWTKQSLTFHAVDKQKYPCFSLAMECAEKGKNYPCALSSANEVAVSLFLQGKIKFLEIKDYIDFALCKVKEQEVSYESLMETDYLARLAVHEKFGE